MARKIVRNVSIDAWSSNPSVTNACGEFSDLAAGYYSRQLKLPITPDRKACYERHGLFAPKKYEEMFSSVEFLTMLDSVALKELSGGIAFSGTSNHWHFMVDGLGTLSSAVMRPDCALYVDSELSDDQIGFLRSHAGIYVSRGLRQIEKITDDVIRISNFRFCANKSIRFKVPAARNTLHVVSRPPKSNDSKLFVLRKNARVRRLLNQDALAAKLEKDFGFTPVDPGAMSLDLQKKLFSTARIIVGPHGAGLTNTMFSECPQGLVEIHHSKRQQFFKLMCDGLGARHLFVEGVPENVQKDSSRIDDADYTVDEQSVVQAVKEFSTQFDF